MRANLPPLPAYMRPLPVDPKTGYPVPFFVQWLDGKPDFRIANALKMLQSAREGLCMICGGHLVRGGPSVFALGPLSVLSKATDEAAMHPCCAEWSAKVCPWMARPGKASRRTDSKPVNAHVNPDAIETPTPPAVWCLYDTPDWSGTFNRSTGSMTLQVGPPQGMTWWSAGRAATRDEVKAALADAYLEFQRRFPGHEGEIQAQLDPWLEELGQWLPEVV